MPELEEEELHHKAHRQHAIPQHIEAFKFKLVGQFTLKQFTYFGGFGLLAWVAIASGLHPVLKWPAAGVLTTLGISFAFIPVAGRPLDKMVTAFFKAITVPTQRVWIKKGGLPEFFQLPVGKAEVGPPTSKIAASRKALEEYLSRFKPKLTRADVFESTFISRLDFGISLPAKVATAVKKIVKEKLEKEVTILPGVAAEVRRPVGAAVIPIAAPVNFVIKPVITLPSPGRKPVFLTPIGEVKVRKLHSAPNLSEFTLKIRGEKKFEISPQLRARLGLISEEAPEDLKTEPKLEEEVEVVTISELKQDGKTKTSKVAKTKVASPKDLNPNSLPNIIVGTVKDAAGHLLEEVILIVKNEQGTPVRALKTNLLGQFAISTPLENGKYRIEAEKEGHKFSIIEFEAKGVPIPSIEVVPKD